MPPKKENPPAGRGRGRGRGRGEAAAAPTGRGRGRGEAAAAPTGRGRGRGAAAATDDTKEKKDERKRKRARNGSIFGQNVFYGSGLLQDPKQFI